MATLTVTPIRTFTSGETVTPTKLNELSQPTVAISNIVNADISASAAIAKSKLALTGEIVEADIANGAVTNAKIASGVDASKLTTGTLPADRIGSSAITTARINDGAVTAAKLDGAQTGSAPIYGCRAWVNFNGTRNATDTGASTNGANVLIRASGNVSSVTRVATGQYTVNFTTAMPDANYSTHATTTSNSSSAFSASTVDGRTLTTTSSVRIVTSFANASNNSYYDPDDVSVAIFR